MRLSDARALLPHLTTAIHHPAVAMAALHKLADWCQRYTPTVSIDGEDGVWLDVTGATHFYGDEAGLLADLSARLSRLGFAHQLGLAETPGAAWAVARFSDSVALSKRIVPPGGVVRRLAPLPLAALRLEQDALYLLNRFGFKTIGQLVPLPRASLKRRFPSSDIGEAVVARMDQTLGKSAEPLVPLRPAPLYSEQISAPEPILQTESFIHGLERLLERLCRRLEQDFKGATAVTFSAYRSDGGVAHIDRVTARPSRNANHLMSLFAGPIETIDPGFGVDHLRLSVQRAERLDTTQLALTAAAAGQSDAGALVCLMDRLASRLGAGAVQRIDFYQSHIPERSERRVSALSQMKPGAAQQKNEKALRPLRLLPRPEPIQVITEVPEGAPKRFVWRRVAHHVRLAEGPERIAPEWWRHTRSDQQQSRDYYRVEDENGQRFWLFRAGFYDDRDRLPAWHLHGLYA